MFVEGWCWVEAGAGANEGWRGCLEGVGNGVSKESGREGGGFVRVCFKHLKKMKNIKILNSDQPPVTKSGRVCTSLPAPCQVEVGGLQEGGDVGGGGVPAVEEEGSLVRTGASRGSGILTILVGVSWVPLIFIRDHDIFVHI